MSAHLRWSGFLAMTGLLMAACGGECLAEGKKTLLDQKTLDVNIYKVLGKVCNRGADLYNSGDTAGCYRLYQGALLTLQPLLDHRPELQKAIADSLEEARKTPEQFKRAFVLRDVIDKIRGETRGTPPAATRAIPPPAKAPPTSPSKTLWERLGGQENVARVVDDFVAGAAGDPKVNFSRDGKYPLDEAGAARLKKMIVELISTATGGPLTYTGRNMKVAHQGMGITSAQFEALAGHLQTALEKNGARADDVKSLMSVIAAMKKDIVEARSAAPTPGAQSLWESLGGAKGVAKVVDDFVAGAVADPKVNFWRDGKYKLDDAGVADLKKKLVDMISSVTGGPRKYTGKAMKDAHKGMGITDAEFSAAAGNLRAALEKNGAKPDDIKAVLADIESTRKAIVEAKVAAARPATLPPAKTLWERLGGTDNVKKIVDDFAAAAGSDPKVNFSRDGRFKLEPDEAADLKKKVVDFISDQTGGPFKYKGRSMKDAHQGMGITDAEFDAYSAHFKVALEKNGVKADDVTEALKMFEKTRKDIIEAKPAVKNPEGKKAADTKEKDRKDVIEKKPTEKKSEAKKAPEKE